MGIELSPFFLITSWVFFIYILLRLLLKVRKGIRLTTEERILAWIGLFLLAVSVAFQLFSFYSVTPTFLAPYSLYLVIGFAFIGGFSLAFLAGRHSLRKNVPNNMVVMHKGRGEVNLEELLNMVKDEYWSLAVTQLNLSKSLSPIVLEMVKKGKHFRLLVTDAHPNQDVSGERLPEYFRDSLGKTIHEGLESDVDGVLKRFKRNIIDKLTADELERFDVRQYNLPITHTMIIIDPKTDNAKIQFEVFHYLPVEGKQPVFIIQKAKHPEVFNNLLESFENAYNEATPIDWNQLS